jgi:EAL domain-containing protein (putative c-di-GMP-specific phosphodiesterase class I)
VIGMGRNLKQRVIAEGVETHAQLEFLQTHQCEGGQGFHFSHPVPAEDFAHLLVAKNGVPQGNRAKASIPRAVPPTP